MQLHRVPQVTNNGGNRYCQWLMPNGMPCNKVFINFSGLMEHLGREHDVQGSASRRVVCRWLSHQGLRGQEYRRDAFRRHIGIHVRLFVRCTECVHHVPREISNRTIPSNVVAKLKGRDWY